jgi:hypothetical protein
MSSDASDLNQGPDYDRLIRNALIAGLVGLAIWLGAVIVGPGPALRSYLVSYLFWIALGAGSLSITMLHHLTGGAWGLLIRRPMEAAAMTLPLLALFFLPIALGVSELYPWARTSGHIPHLGDKRAYLNVPFFLIRACVYFALWSALAWIIGPGSRAQDRTEDQAISNRLKTISGPGLALLFLTGTFMAIDWGMSLEPDWASTMYPPMIIVGQGLETFAMMIAVSVWLSKREPFSRIATPGRFQDLGNLLLTFVMLWAYLAFSQFLIIWSGNLREEIPWYMRRMHGGWEWIALILVTCHFFLPFFALLLRTTKRTPRSLSYVAIFVIALHYMDLHWLVKPAAAWPQKTTAESIFVALRWCWADLAAWVCIGGITVAAFLWILKQAPLVPIHDHAMMALREHEHEQHAESSGHSARGGH